MAFLDDVGKALADKGREAAQKAKEMAEILQMKGQISAENNKVKELYGAIGVLYFKKHREEPDDEYQMFFPEIEKSLARIGELEARVRELEKTQVCASCGAVLRKEDVFCSKCGAFVVQEEKADEENPDTGAEEDGGTRAVVLTSEAGEDAALSETEEDTKREDIFADEDQA